MHTPVALYTTLYYSATSHDIKRYDSPLGSVLSVRAWSRIHPFSVFRMATVKYILSYMVDSPADHAICRNNDLRDQA